jgi:hypothetical protein
MVRIVDNQHNSHTNITTLVSCLPVRRGGNYGGGGGGVGGSGIIYLSNN